LVITGCSGTPTTTVIARDEITSVLLVGNLVGGAVVFNNGFQKTILKADLQDKLVTNLSTIRNSEYQNLDKVLFRVEPGELTVSFTSPNGKKTNRNIFITPGITNELRLD
jgi:hypothetical protein